MINNARWTLFAAILVLSIATASIGGASTTEVSINPSTSTAEVDETFAINITVTDVTNLYGWEAKVSFDPDILEAVNATEGPFLETAGYETLFPPPNLDNAEGTVSCGALFVPPFPGNGVNGSGTLATIAFKPIGKGRIALDFQKSDLFTVIAGVDKPIEHTTSDGTFDNGAGGVQFSIELIVAIVVVVGVVGAAVFYMTRKRSATP